MAAPAANNNRSSSSDDNDDDDDPIVGSYSVFIKPPLAENRRLFVLQMPNAFHAAPERARAPPIREIRLKPRTGMMEVDVPLDAGGAQYDRGKGVSWGSAMQRAVAAKGGGSLGLAGGFGVAAPAARQRRAAAAAGGAGGAALFDDDDGGVPTGRVDWQEAVREDRVLRTRTLGGLSQEVKDCRYMVGVFQGKNIHLTPVSSLVHLRPQINYIDALEQEALSRRGFGNRGGLGESAPGAGGAGAKEGPGSTTARAIHMTIKPSGDGSEVVTETMADRLRAVQTEEWHRMGYEDEDTEAAWLAYQESLLLPPGEGGPSATDDDQTMDEDEEDAGGDGESGARPGRKGKGKAKAIEQDDGGFGAADLVDRVPTLQTSWGEDQLLRAVSGIKPGDKKPGEEAATAAMAPPVTDADPKGKGVAKEGLVKAEEKGLEPKKRPGRPPKSAAGPSTSTASKRGGKAKAPARGSSSATAMELD